MNGTQQKHFIEAYANLWNLAYEYGIVDLNGIPLIESEDSSFPLLDALHTLGSVAYSSSFDEFNNIIRVGHNAGMTDNELYDALQELVTLGLIEEVEDEN